MGRAPSFFPAARVGFLWETSWGLLSFGSVFNAFSEGESGFFFPMDEAGIFFLVVATEERAGEAFFDLSFKGDLPASDRLYLLVFSFSVCCIFPVLTERGGLTIIRGMCRTLVIAIYIR